MLVIFFLCYILAFAYLPSPHVQPGRAFPRHLLFLFTVDTTPCSLSLSGQFGVVMNEGHYKDLLLELVPPPAQVGASSAGRIGVCLISLSLQEYAQLTDMPLFIGGDAVSTAPKANLSADLLMMGFPTRLPHSAMAALCVCHSELKSEGMPFVLVVFISHF